MPSLPVFVSHTGKTLQLSCSSTTRVDAVQQALVALTGLSLADQIVMCEGSRLDPHKTLAAYGLPVDEHDQPHDVFLYNRALLKPGAPPPTQQTAPNLTWQVAAQRSAQDYPHSLDKASSPLLRALPEYQRHFQLHKQQGLAAAEASQQRYAFCAQLVGEQEVQALSIDAARTNVEAHFSYICNAFEGFMQRYQQQHALHAEVLTAFEGDLEFLSTTEVHPALKRQGCMRLVDLVDVQPLREGWEACHKSHSHFAAKVSELEALFALLKGDVESLFMQAPSVDLEELNSRLAEMHGHLDEQGSIVQALSSDLTKVDHILDQTTRQLEGASTASVSVQLSDTCQMLETMHESHVNHLLLRVESCDAALEEFTSECVKCKNALTQDVQHQLQCIASQQSRIREMKDKLALFGEALGKQESGVGKLMLPRRVAAAYKQCLAECVRRSAFAEKYAQSAAKLAESMGRFREKEVATREAFRRHVEKYLPASLIQNMGLQSHPPHCQVTLPSSTYQQLLPVTVEDMRRFQLPTGGSTAQDSAFSTKQPAPVPGKPQQREEEMVAEEEGGGPAFEDLTTSLQIENATLRAELASRVAMDCIRAAQFPALRDAAEAPSTRSARASAAGELAASPSSREPTAGVAGASRGDAEAQQVPLAAVQKFEKAVAAKDALVAELQGQLSRSQAQISAYEQRILSLEEQLSSLAATSARTASTSGVHEKRGPSVDQQHGIEQGEASAGGAVSDGGGQGHKAAEVGGGQLCVEAQQRGGDAPSPSSSPAGAAADLQTAEPPSVGEANAGPSTSAHARVDADPRPSQGSDSALRVPSGAGQCLLEGSLGLPPSESTAPTCAAPAARSSPLSHTQGALAVGGLSASQNGSGSTSVLGALSVSMDAGQALSYSSSSVGAGATGRGGLNLPSISYSMGSGQHHGETSRLARISPVPNTALDKAEEELQAPVHCGGAVGGTCASPGGARPSAMDAAPAEPGFPGVEGEHVNKAARAGDAGCLDGSDTPGSDGHAQDSVCEGRAGLGSGQVSTHSQPEDPSLAQHPPGPNMSVEEGQQGGGALPRSIAGEALDEGSDVDGIEVLSGDSDEEGGYGTPGSHTGLEQSLGGGVEEA